MPHIKPDCPNFVRILVRILVRMTSNSFQAQSPLHALPSTTIDLQPDAAAGNKLLYLAAQAWRQGSCNLDGGSPSSFSALPMRHWHALHIAGLALIARDGAASAKPICAIRAVRHRVEHASPRGSTMRLPSCLRSFTNAHRAKRQFLFDASAQ